jgi:lipopolysaccharide export system permease protein
MGRSFNLLSAAFYYMVYSNGLNIIQSLIAQGKLDFWVALLVPHALAALVVVLLFGYRMGLPRPASRRMRTGAAAPAG